jgi:hypothetical protein
MKAEVSYKMVKTPKEAYLIVKRYITPELMEKFNVKADFDYNETDSEIRAKGKGFELQLSFLPQKALVDLDVSFFLKAVQGVVLSKIERMLQSIL